MQIIADLQLHSRFSRAVSPQMTIPNIAAWAGRKGIGLVATGDWTHPLWMREIKENLEEVGNGLLRLKSSAQGPEVGMPLSRAVKVQTSNSPSSLNSQGRDGTSKVHASPGLSDSPLFLLATEVSCIYSQGGKVRRVHTLIWVPTLASADAINKEMTRRGCNLMSDGRPIIGLTSIQVAELVLTIEPKALIIPAHAWTPWFSVYGSLGGFDSIDEAFGPYAKHIYAVETGLSSNPSMNWRIKELDNRSIVSFSDAHSGPKLGREATVFEVGELSYDAIYCAIKQTPAEVGTPISRAASLANKNFDPSSEKLVSKSSKIRIPKSEDGQNFVGSTQPSIAYTIEFYPEEGKYHYTGHRACNIRLSPQESKAKGSTCPVCGKPLTQGVMQRVEELASRSEEELKLASMRQRINASEAEVTVTKSKAFPNRPAFVMLVPLQEIIAESVGSPVASPKVQTPYFRLTEALGGEFNVLLVAGREDIAKIAGERVAAGVEKVRTGDLVIDPGYDGVFGVVKLWGEGEEKPLVDASREQLQLL